MLMIAGFDTISFGFYVALNALTPVWLQKAKKFGGFYGFTVGENATCKPNSKPLMTFKLMPASHIRPLVRLPLRSHLRVPHQRSPPPPSRSTAQPHLEARIPPTRPLAHQLDPHATGSRPRWNSVGI